MRVKKLHQGDNLGGKWRRFVTSQGWGHLNTREETTATAFPAAKAQQGRRTRDRLVPRRVGQTFSCSPTRLVNGKNSGYMSETTKDTPFPSPCPTLSGAVGQSLFLQPYPGTYPSLHPYTVSPLPRNDPPPQPTSSTLQHWNRPQSLTPAPYRVQSSPVKPRGGPAERAWIGSTEQQGPAVGWRGPQTGSVGPLPELFLPSRVEAFPKLQALAGGWLVDKSHHVDLRRTRPPS